VPFALFSATEAPLSTSSAASARITSSDVSSSAAILTCLDMMPMCSRSVASHVFLISQVGFPSVRFCQSANTAADTVPSSTAAMAACVRVRNRGAVSCYLARLLRFQFLFIVAS
jgi:hypothetical protein